MDICMNTMIVILKELNTLYAIYVIKMYIGNIVVHIDVKNVIMMYVINVLKNKRNLGNKLIKIETIVFYNSAKIENKY